MNPEWVKYLVPMPHHKEKTLWRVPVQHVPPTYTVWVGKQHVRVFDDISLPDEMKTKITMAKAEAVQYKQDSELYGVDVFIYRGGGLENVAWRASETMYIVVMNNNELNKLKGVY